LRSTIKSENFQWLKFFPCYSLLFTPNDSVRADAKYTSANQWCTGPGFWSPIRPDIFSENFRTRFSNIHCISFSWKNSTKTIHKWLYQVSHKLADYKGKWCH